MGRLVDLDDLIDANEAARLCGLASRKVLSANLSDRAGAWKEFPDPVIDRPPSRFWLRSEVRAWDERHPERHRRGRPPKSDG